MNFVEIVDTVDVVEAKLDTLSVEKLELFEALLVEGSEIEFDVVHHLDHLVGFVDSYTDEQASTIVEAVDCGEILNILLESVRKNASDPSAVITEAMKQAGELDVDGESDRISIPLFSVVTNVLTEMTSEEAVEGMPAEMVFDIAIAAQNLDLCENANELDMNSLLSEISTKLQEAIRSGAIDKDTADYEGETLAEFLNDYDSTDDLLEEMTKITAEDLFESPNEDSARLLTKAKKATLMLEAERCPKGDIKCMEKKGKAAKAYFAKNSMKGTNFNPKSILNVTKITGKLGKIMRDIKKNNPRYPDVYLRNVVIPAIIKNMAKKKGRKRKTSSMNKRA